MEQCLRILPDTSTKKFLKKFEKCTAIQKKELQNELTIACFFAKAGFEVNYELKIDNKTPDWTILKAGRPKLIIEVATPHQPYDQTKTEAFITALSKALAGIKGQYLIHCELDNIDIHKAAKQVDKIVEEVKLHISNKPKRLLHFEEFQISLKLSNYKTRSGHCEFIFYNSINHSPIRLEDKVSEKIHAYRKIVSKHDLYFLLAIASDKLNLVDDFDYENMLFGTKIDNRWLGKNFSLVYQETDGLFTKYEDTFHGFIWAPYEVQIKEICLLLNPVHQKQLRSFLFADRKPSYASL